MSFVLRWRKSRENWDTREHQNCWPTMPHSNWLTPYLYLYIRYLWSLNFVPIERMVMQAVTANPVILLHLFVSIFILSTKRFFFRTRNKDLFKEKKREHNINSRYLQWNREWKKKIMKKERQIVKVKVDKEQMQIYKHTNVFWLGE